MGRELTVSWDFVAYPKKHRAPSCGKCLQKRKNCQKTKNPKSNASSNHKCQK